MDEPNNSGEHAAFEILVDRDSEIPIGVQLAWALRARISDGTFGAGQRLPGLRELAETTDVNINTVRAVYQRLDQEGLIDTKQGSGTFVTPEPLRRSDISVLAANAAHDAHELGVDPREVAAALYVTSANPTTTAGTTAQRRRLLRTQITALEMALGEIEAEHPALVPPSTHSKAPTSVAPRLLDADQLAHVRRQQLLRLATLQRTIEEQAEATSLPPTTPPGDAADAKSRRASRARATPRAAPANG